MAKDEDWYWACEPALVLADEDLALCPAPDGWPDEGLSCLGLYFLMLCVMHRSPRRGYLLASNGLPLTTADLARLVRRPVEVVNKVQAVLLSRSLFSVSGQGEIYSRGMVKRQELRLKRQDSGSKGGKARVLVEQTLKEKVKQTLTDYGSKEKIDNDSDPQNGKIAPSRAGPGYAAHRMDDAKEVAEAYRVQVDSAHRPTTAVNAILDIFANDGVTKEQLLQAVKRWADECKEANPDRSKRMGANKWFQDGHWRAFADEYAGSLDPNAGETPEQRIARMTAFNRAAKIKAGVPFDE